MSKITATQSITGFKLLQFSSKKSKDTELIKLVLQADTDDIGAGEFDLGAVMKALQAHMASDTDLGISVLVDKEVDE